MARTKEEQTAANDGSDSDDNPWVIKLNQPSIEKVVVHLLMEGA